MLEVSFDDLKTYTKAGTFALVNELDRRVYIGASKNLLSTLARHIEQIEDGRHSVTDLIPVKDKLVARLVTSDIDDDCLLKYKKHELAKWYEAQGYKLYNPTDIPTYTPIVRYNRNKKSVDVLLKSKGYSYKLVRSFPDKVEANEYLKNTSLYDMILTTIGTNERL